MSKRMEMPASAVDPGLPDDLSFRAWLDRTFPAETVESLTASQCAGADRRCVRLSFHVPSRARSVILELDYAAWQFEHGAVVGAEAEPMAPLRSLAELPMRLGAPIRPLPLACPGGTRLQLQEEAAGRVEWCERPDGTKHGATRAWFSTGLYLMYRGRYDAGAKAGRWTECDRFERCRGIDYGG